MNSTYGCVIGRPSQDRTSDLDPKRAISPEARRQLTNAHPIPPHNTGSKAHNSQLDGRIFALWMLQNCRQLRRRSIGGSRTRFSVARDLLSKSYLGQPVAEYLIHRHSGELKTEVDHPVLQTPGHGRPRQIDYALLTRDKTYIEVAIECKWIAETPYSKQRIINDLLRLECIRVERRQVKRFLLIAGLKEQVRTQLQGPRYKCRRSTELVYKAAAPIRHKEAGHRDQGEGLPTRFPPFL